MSNVDINVDRQTENQSLYCTLLQAGAIITIMEINLLLRKDESSLFPPYMDRHAEVLKISIYKIDYMYLGASMRFAHYGSLELLL